MPGLSTARSALKVTLVIPGVVGMLAIGAVAVPAKQEQAQENARPRPVYELVVTKHGIKMRSGSRLQPIAAHSAALEFGR